MVEIELHAAAAARAGFKSKIDLICMMQITVITIGTDEGASAEVYGTLLTHGQEHRLEPQIEEILRDLESADP